MPNGTYTLTLNTENTATTHADAGEITGGATTPIVIDHAAPRVSDVSASPETFFPDKSGSRSRVRIRGSLSEAAAHVRVELVREGIARRTLRLGAQPAGEFTAVWNGRRADDKPSVQGSYRYRFVVTDKVGNQATRPGGTVALRRG